MYINFVFVAGVKKQIFFVYCMVLYIVCLFIGSYKHSAGIEYQRCNKASCYLTMF